MSELREQLEKLRKEALPIPWVRVQDGKEYHLYYKDAKLAFALVNSLDEILRALKVQEAAENVVDTSRAFFQSWENGYGGTTHLAKQADLALVNLNAALSDNKEAAPDN